MADDQWWFDLKTKSAVQDSKVVTLDDEESAALAFATVLSLPSVLDSLPRRLGRAVDR